MDAQRVRLGGREARLERTVDQEAPHLLEGDDAHEVLEVDAPVAQRAALAVGLRDPRVERHDIFQPAHRRSLNRRAFS